MGNPSFEDGYPTKNGGFPLLQRVIFKHTAGFFGGSPDFYWLPEGVEIGSHSHREEGCTSLGVPVTGVGGGFCILKG